MNHLERANALSKQQQVGSTSRRQIGEDFAKEHLVECCVELLEQRKTNTLAGGRMAELREIIADDDIYTAQRLVESLAAEFIATELGRKS